MIFYERHRRSESEICCRMDMHIKAKCHPCWIFAGYGYVLPSQIINYWYQTPTSQAATLPTSGYIAAISTVYFVAPGKAVVFRCMPSAAPKSSWCLLEMSLSAHKGGDQGINKTTICEGQEWTPSKSMRMHQNMRPKSSIDGQ